MLVFPPTFIRCMPIRVTYRGIPNWTLHIIYGDTLFLFYCPCLGISHLVLILSTAQLLIVLFPLSQSTHYPAEVLNSKLLSIVILLVPGIELQSGSLRSLMLKYPWESMHVSLLSRSYGFSHRTNGFL